MGDGSCAFQIMRDPAYTPPALAMCALRPVTLPIRTSVGLPLWAAQHTTCLPREQDFPAGRKPRYLRAERASAAKRTDSARRIGARSTTRVEYGNERERERVERSSRISFGRRERPTLSGHSGPKKRTLHPPLPRPTLAGRNARRKRNLRFQKPNYTLDTLFQSHSVHSPGSPVLSSSLPIPFLSPFTPARRPSPCRGRGANARQTRGIVMHTGINDRRKEEASEEGLSAGREERAKDKEDERKREEEREGRRRGGRVGRRNRPAVVWEDAQIAGLSFRRTRRERRSVCTHANSAIGPRPRAARCSPLTRLSFSFSLHLSHSLSRTHRFRTVSSEAGVRVSRRGRTRRYRAR